MWHLNNKKSGKPVNAQSGFSILETLISAVVLLVGVVPVLALFGVAAGQNKRQGDFATRTIEYSQDKMEQLLSLDFNDASTNTTVFPASPTGGTGLGGVMASSTTVGGTNIAAPVAGYVDYLDANGNLLPGSEGSFYIRLWSISTDGTGNIKTVQVVTAAESSVATTGPAPRTNLVGAKGFGH